MGGIGSGIRPYLRRGEKKFPRTKFQFKQKVLFTPEDGSKDPSKRNAGKVGKIKEIFWGTGRTQNFYLVKFGPGIWDEVCAPENELQSA